MEIAPWLAGYAPFLTGRAPGGLDEPLAAGCAPGRAVCQNSPHPARNKGRARGGGEGGGHIFGCFFVNSLIEKQETRPTADHVFRSATQLKKNA